MADAITTDSAISSRHCMIAAGTTAITLDGLVAEYDAFLKAQGLPDVDALEMVMCIQLSRGQLAWVCDFIDRWTDAARLEQAAGI